MPAKKTFLKNYELGFENFVKTPVVIEVKDNKKVLKCVKFKTDFYRYEGQPNFAVKIPKGIVMFDLDSGKEGKVDGITWFEENIGPLDEHFGLITTTPSGGFHCFCSYNTLEKLGCDGFKQFNEENFFRHSYVGLHDLGKDIAMDIICSDNVSFQGQYYDVIKNDGIKPISSVLKETITMFRLSLTEAKFLRYHNVVYTLTTDMQVDYDYDFKGQKYARHPIVMDFKTEYIKYHDESYVYENDEDLTGEDYEKIKMTQMSIDAVNWNKIKRMRYGY